MSILGQMVDLDELVLCCRDEKAREYIREAVACYKSGAFRSAIVAAWIAVVFDILHKLRELDLTGDKNARKHLDDFEKIVAGGESKLKEALDFERGILGVAASDFELLTPNEKLDLARLQKDRNRCAHPSMQAMETVYEPTAELARSHIRNAVEILLAREPVQGKAALERIRAEVTSEYFPMSTEKAVDHFKNGPLVRARDSLVRNLSLVLVKDFLRGESMKDGEKIRLATALGAVIELHRSRAERFLGADLPRVLASMPDEKLPHLIFLVKTCPFIWKASGKNGQEKMKRYLLSKSLSGAELQLAIAAALCIPHLENTARERISDLSVELVDELLQVKEVLPKLAPLVPGFIRDARCVKSFRSAEAYYQKRVLRLSPILTANDVREMLEAVAENSQAYDAGGMPEILVQFFNKTEHIREECSDHWVAFAEKIGVLQADERSCIDYSELFGTLRDAGVLPASEGEDA